MKTKQLANVLIKILGLSECAQSAMHCVSGLVNLIAAAGVTGRTLFLWPNFLSGAVLAAIGIFLIMQSRAVAEFLFKDEAE